MSKNICPGWGRGLRLFFTPGVYRVVFTHWRSRWRIGADSVWYGGPHYVVHIGPFEINWGAVT